MDIQTLIEKAKNGPLTPDEQAFVLQNVERELTEMREKHPEEYARILEHLVAFVATIKEAAKEN